MKLRLLTRNVVTGAALSSLLVLSTPAFAIKKCKDADGNWHYGDVAVEECENSKVTTLTERGFVKDEKDAPKTSAEISAEAEEKALIEREQRDKIAAADEKRRVLSIYETEDDIDRQRDNQVRSVQSNIDVHESYLSNMEKRLARYQEKLEITKGKSSREKLLEQISSAETRMKEYALQLESLEEQKAAILARFKKERETYLALKNSTD